MHNLKRFTDYQSLHKFSGYQPYTFTNELTLLEKVNNVIYAITELGNSNNAIVDYFDEFVKTFDKNLYKTVFDVISVWKDDEVINQMLLEIFSKNIDVTVFGASSTAMDNTSAFQIAIDVQSGIQKPIFVPEGVFNIQGMLTATGDMHLQLADKAVINKTKNTMLLVCDGRGVEDKGYGKRASQILIEGGTYKGNLDNNIALSMRFTNCSKITVRNTVFDNAVQSGHVLDFMGCENILVENVDFIGYKPVAGTYYTEAIQIDNSWGNGGANADESITKLPTRKVVVKGCRCLPLISNEQYPLVHPFPINENVTVIYPAPNLIGNHSERRGYPYYNIVVDNNEIIYGVDFEQAGFINQGWIHFRGANQIRITNNKFYGTTTAGYCIRIHMNDYADDSDDSVPNPYGNPQYYKQGVPNTSENIVIANNEFLGFKSNRAVVYLVGFRYGGEIYPLKNTYVTDNIFKDCNPAYPIIARSIEKVSIRGNAFENCSRAMTIEDARACVINDNTMTDVQNIAIIMSSNAQDQDLNYPSGNSISNNIFRRCAVGIYNEFQNGNLIANNIFDQCTGHATLKYLIGGFNVNTGLLVTGNIATTSPSTCMVYFAGGTVNTHVGNNFQAKDAISSVYGGTSKLSNNRPVEMKLMVLGDQLSSSTSTSRTYWDFMQEYLGESYELTTEYKIGNTWTIGSMAIEVNNFVDSDSGYLFIQGGLRDFVSNVSEASFRTNMQNLLTNAYTSLPNTQIYVILPIYRNTTADSDITPNTVGLTLKHYRDIMREICQANAVPAIEMQRLSNINPNIPANKTALMPNGEYPNRNGHKNIARVLIQEMGYFK